MPAGLLPVMVTISTNNSCDVGEWIRRSVNVLLGTKRTLILMHNDSDEPHLTSKQMFFISNH